MRSRAHESLKWFFRNLLNNISSQNIVVFIVGPSASGKSRFTSILLQSEEVHLIYSGDQSSNTTGALAKRCRFDGVQSDVIVDTPSFYTHEGPDGEEVLKEWMDQNYTKPCKAAGVLYMHDLAFNPDDAALNVSKHLDAFRRTCRQCLVPRVIHVVPTLRYEAKLSDEGNKTSATQLQRQVNYEGARFCGTSSDGTPFDGKPETALGIVQGLLADCNNAKAGVPRSNSTSPVGKAEVTENDYAIFVLSSKGVGKNWLIGQLSNSHDMIQHPSTRHVESWRCDLKIGSGSIVVVDIPSFPADCNDSDAENTMVADPLPPDREEAAQDTVFLHTDHKNADAGKTVAVDPLLSTFDHKDIEAEITVTDWLKWKFTKTCHPGILYLHSLDSDPTPADVPMSQHLESFARAFPDNFTVPSRVYVVPTSKSDSTLPSETLSQRLSKLKTMAESLKGNGNRDWHASVFPGVFKGQPEIAWSAALMLLKDIAKTQVKEPIPLPMEPTLKRMTPQFPDGRLAVKDLADHLIKKFRGKERKGDLDAMIMLGRTALGCIPAEYLQCHYALINLADLVSERFEKEGVKEDLDKVIMIRRAASNYIVPNNSQRERLLLELEDCLYQRFRREDSIVDLEEIISLRRAALEHTPLPDRCRRLLNLADSLQEKFQKQRLVDDIDEAIRLARTASELCRPGHPDQPLSQGCLARCLRAKVRTEGARGRPKGAQIDPSSSGSSDIKHFIKKVFFETVENLPPHLLHTPTGVMCNRDAQLSHFESSPYYERLLLSASSLTRQQLQTEINSTVTDFFPIAMLSHRWGNGEPLLREIEGKKIYDLRGTDGLEKLQDFCLLALERNFQWAWSDTCCIDKDSSAELQEAIGSMFSWYRQSSVTIVYLSDVFEADTLADSVWFTRGWTLQELLASHTVFFYMYDWSLYTKGDTANHKKDPTVLEELQRATGVAKQHLTDFDPGMDDARTRLHWASGRSTTRPEDIAYSLFGIFKVHLPVLYGESVENALGRLLAEIISRSGDISVLDWVGEASSFNSCFPASLVPYQTVPHIQPIPNDPAIRNGLDLEKTQKLYCKLAALPRAGFVNNRLTLPSIIHPITAVRLQSSSTSPSHHTYEIHASRLTPLEVTLSVNLDKSADRYMLARPWHPKSLPMQIGGDDDAVWGPLEQLKQPFNAFLLEKLRHNEYKRIASDCIITACVQDLAGILDTEVLVPEIV